MGCDGFKLLEEVASGRWVMAVTAGQGRSRLGLHLVGVVMYDSRQDTMYDQTNEYMPADHPRDPRKKKKKAPDTLQPTQTIADEIPKRLLPPCSLWDGNRNAPECALCPV